MKPFNPVLRSLLLIGQNCLCSTLNTWLPQTELVGANYYELKNLPYVDLAYTLVTL